MDVLPFIHEEKEENIVNVVSKPHVELMIPNQRLTVSNYNLDVIYLSNQITVTHDLQLDLYTINVHDDVIHQLSFPKEYLSKLCSKFEVFECAHKVFVKSLEPNWAEKT